ncbi:mycofactocin-coupled SDR family oxidoreductase [Pseudonocardia halophobica]|uniref:mycofactocin-coupled SDR family oxidoreductase n=1 Tax=Pseudonocardia halophobica TaxID=29401 RepID=UPI003D8B8446
MGLLDGRIALVTGAARGQGRSHAVRLAEEGADVIAIDVCKDIETMQYSGPRPEDLKETARLVEALDRRAVTVQADVRDAEAMRRAVRTGVAELGGLDIVCANAGVLNTSPAADISDAEWAATVDINLTGVWNTVQPAIPVLVEQGRGGSIVITSSSVGLRGALNTAHYAATKHGVVGLARTLALELGPHSIRVNTIHPTAILTDMIDNKAMFRRFRPDLADPGPEDVRDRYQGLNILPVPFIEPVDISNAIVWLSSDQARYVTAAAIPVDAGATQKA